MTENVEHEKDLYRRYCYDCSVFATNELFTLRKDYLKNKITLGREKNIPDARALYMTNAKLTAASPANRTIRMTT